MFENETASVCRGPDLWHILRRVSFDRKEWLTRPGNRERARASCRKWRLDPANRATIAAGRARNADRQYATRRGSPALVAADKQRQRRWRERQPKDWLSFRQRLLSHGITLDQYHAKLEAQDFGCGICGVEANTHRRSHGHLSIDHDHKTGRFRGLLCLLCNTTLGQVKDNADTLRRALAYLEQAAA